MPLRVSSLAELAACAEPAFGGKALGLARLIAAGARVPAGFAVEATTELPGTWPAFEREAILERARSLLASGSLAVRSSAVGEDSAERSFAGLFETVLHVTNEDELLAAMSRCVASGGTERVSSYAGRSEPMPVGLVIQSMVAARVAGICFTRDPTGKDGAIVIEAVPGTGDALASGHVEPQRWRLYRSGLGRWERRREGAEGALDGSRAERIAGEALELATRAGHPLDLEWAIDAGDTLFWLQARPISTPTVSGLPDVDRAFDGADDGPVVVWSNWNVRETLPDPMSPLTWGFWRESVLPMLGEQLFGVAGDSSVARHVHALDLVEGRLYINMNGFLSYPMLGPLARRLIHVIDARVAEPMERLIRDGVLRPRRLPGSRVTALLRLAGASVASTVRLARGLRPERSLAALHEAGMAIGRREDVARLSDADLLAELDLWRRPECRTLRDGLQMEAVAVLVYGVAAAAFRGHERALQLLATGIPANPTTRISIAIDGLVEAGRPLADLLLQPLTTPELLERLRRDPEGARWLARLDAFLSLYGHRGPGEFDLGAARWLEDPTMIVELVRAGLRSPPRETVAERMSRLAVERRREVEAAVASAPAWRRPILRRLARLVELYMPLREAPKHYGIFVFQRIRQAARELGTRLTRTGVLSSPDDVFLLDWGELHALARGGPVPAGLAELIGRRRTRLERFRRTPARDFVRSDGVPVLEVEEEPATAGALRGAAVSSGIATGPIRVLRQPDPRAMADGDVIVMEFADPGWTPLFPRAAAVVMEVGGTMCHAAVVAREMGIPAVFAVRNATALLADGERVTVDGARGTIRRS